MSESSWRENSSYNELEPLSALLAELSQASEPEEPVQHPPQKDTRRRKAAVALVMIWGGTIALHLSTWGSWLILGFVAVMGIHAVRVLLAHPLPDPEPLSTADPNQLPFVSLMVAAKNEEAVISRLVNTLCSLDYPTERYELWVIDDNSTDQTSSLLKQLTEEYEQLRVFHRPVGSGGGKSGALNQVLPLTQGEVIAVFDADAQVTPDLLLRVLPLFERETVGAVQVRKAIANAADNFWTYGQVAEMALDAYFQQQRVAIAGIGELRGNGQFVRRSALERCGGWNEETITDDLDLTIRLHLDQWDINCMTFPAVQEEGVTSALSLWHQRNRWAEGGYQRYLDYWQLILRNRMGTRKTIDLFLFWITQYFIPTAAVPDLLMAVVRSRSLLYSPIASFTVTLSLVGMMLGLRQIRRRHQLADLDSPNPEQKWAPRQALLAMLGLLLHSLLGTVYMFHWFPVIGSATLRMAIRPKRLKWIKTVHRGSHPT